jgi:hypothetical protein
MFLQPSPLQEALALANRLPGHIAINPEGRL